MAITKEEAVSEFKSKYLELCLGRLFDLENRGEFNNRWLSLPIHFDGFREAIYDSQDNTWEIEAFVNDKLETIKL